ncbi:glycosyltransferase [Phaeodactylibacter xiamenensis]|uniref:glycosyltransferase n=1 Tax=Phaeodactylibacter xiamenensis TaxID=1524460 RepID=UPI003BA85D8A
MKLMIITPSLKGGGLERVVSSLSNYLASQLNIQVSLLCLSSMPSFYTIDAAVKLIQCPTNISKLSKFFRIHPLGLWLRKKVKAENPSSIISFGEGYNSFVIISTLGLCIPIYVCNRASPYSSLSGVRGLINPKVYPFANGVILQTNSAKKILSKKYHKSTFHVIGNPVARVIANHKKKLFILNVGRVGGKKNQDWLITYFHKLKSKDNWKLYLVGSGPNEQKCQDLIAKKKLEDKVFMLGQQKEVHQFYEEAAIFAFTSISEGFPNALAEAMAYGCACICFDCIAGPSDLIDNGINGFLIPLDDHHLYQEKLQLLVDDPELRTKLGMAAKEKIKQFEVGKIARKYLEIAFQTS